MPKPKKPASKRQQALKVFRRINRRKSPKRSDFIEALQAECELTANGAATYYQNLKTGPWSE